MKILFSALFAAAALLNGIAAEQCGWQAGGALCPNGLCCSQWGYCGSTIEYCGPCQSQCPNADVASNITHSQFDQKHKHAAVQCGWQAGGALCPNGLCCSQYGYCGSTIEYCGSNCQTQCKDVDVASNITHSQFDENLKHGTECGREARGALCRDGVCCSKWGFCGLSPEYCGKGCQSQCSVAGVASIITRSQFDQMLKHRNDAARQGRVFYTYDAFIAATKSFPLFGTTGDAATCKREIAAFLGQTSHETTGNWTQLLWFWMTPQLPKPSCHDVITGQWSPSVADKVAGRLPGYGMVTNIINGGVECGRGPVSQVADRIGFYKRYCDLLGINYGDNLDCGYQRPFGSDSRLAMVA